MGQRQSVPAAGSANEGSSSSIQQPPTSTAGVAAPSPQEQLQQAVNVNHRRKIMADMIERQSNPSEEDAASHNYGQPIHNPNGKNNNKKNTLSKSNNHENEKSGASKLVTDCRVQQRASLACIEENYENKNEACAHYFEAYKKCRREEHERKLEANAKASAW